MNRTGDSQAWSWPDSPGWRKASIKSEAGKRNEESLYTQLLKLTGYTVKWKKQGAEESKDWCWSWNSNTLATWCKSWLVWKDPDSGKDWGQAEKGTTEDEMVGWHHWLNGHGFVNSGSWWWTGRPGTLRFMGSQRVGHNWATEMNWTEEMDYIANITSDL